MPKLLLCLPSYRVGSSPRGLLRLNRRVGSRSKSLNDSVADVKGNGKAGFSPASEIRAHGALFHHYLIGNRPSYDRGTCPCRRKTSRPAVSVRPPRGVTVGGLPGAPRTAPVCAENGSVPGKRGSRGPTRSPILAYGVSNFSPGCSGTEGTARVAGILLRKKPGLGNVGRARNTGTPPQAGETYRTRG